MWHSHTGQDLDSDECGLLFVCPPFLIFDVELVFLYPWAVAAKVTGWFALVEIIIFFSYCFRFPVCAQERRPEVGLTIKI